MSAAKEVRLTRPISWLDGVDPQTGIITQPGHPQRGLTIAGKILRLPYSTGSTAGAYTLFRLARAGRQPYRIVLEKPDSVTMSAELAGIPVEVVGAKKPPKLSVQAPQKFIRFLEAEASMSGAKDYLTVQSIHISGVSYGTVGEAGLEFLEGLADEDIRFASRPTTNPAGMDMRNWREMGVPSEYAQKQRRIVDALTRMGAASTLTCTPYLVGNLPSPNEHICWGESSAVAYANSVLGARTNREGGIKSVVTAVVGRTPRYGMHDDEDRRPTLKVSVQNEIRGKTELSALAYHVGETFPRAVPIYFGLGEVTESELKAIGAAGAASGSIELFHVSGVTPEANLSPTEEAEGLKIEKGDVFETIDNLSTASREPDLVAIGCPHLSSRELAGISRMLEGRKVTVPFWFFTSRFVLSEVRDLKQGIERSGAKVFADTCMVVAPLKEIGFRTVATDSAKAARYLHTLQQVHVILQPLEELVGSYSRS